MTHSLYIPESSVTGNLRKREFVDIWILLLVNRFTSESRRIRLSTPFKVLPCKFGTSEASVIDMFF